jgi:hypothetical protein
MEGRQLAEPVARTQQVLRAQYCGLTAVTRAVMMML